MTERTHVPCNGCTICCQNDLLILHPEMGDRPEDYETQECTHPLTGQTAVALAHKPGGSCVYLGDGGCTIHDRAPAICREFDCRRFYLNLVRDTTRKERRKLIWKGMYSKALIAEGRRRLKTLKPDHALRSERT